MGTVWALYGHCMGTVWALGFPAACSPRCWNASKEEVLRLIRLTLWLGSGLGPLPSSPCLSMTALCDLRRSRARANNVEAAFAPDSSPSPVKLKLGAQGARVPYMEIETVVIHGCVNNFRRTLYLIPCSGSGFKNTHLWKTRWI